MNCIESFFESVMEIRESWEERNAFSQLDHTIQYDVETEEILRILETDQCKKYDVPKKYKAYIAALTEYIFNLNNREAPRWVYNREYYLAEPDFSEGIKNLCKRAGTDSLKLSAVENAIPEFKKRNYMITDVLSAV